MTAQTPATTSPLAPAPVGCSQCGSTSIHACPGKPLPLANKLPSRGPADLSRKTWKKADAKR